MGKTYESSGGGGFLPKIRFTSQEESFPKGTWFIGTKTKETQGKEFTKEKIVDGKIVVEKNSNKVFTFIVHDASPDLHIQKKQDKLWVDVELDENGEAELNGNAQLDDKVGQVPLEQKVKITFTGKLLNPNSGRYYNNYTVKDAE